jgi:hypothetical protein
LVLQFVTTGFDSDRLDLNRWATRVLGAALGIWITQRAVRLATFRNETTQEAASQESLGRKADYEAFLAQASVGEQRPAPSDLTTSGTGDVTPAAREQK